jgi:putative ABC transport system permease protein
VARNIVSLLKIRKNNMDREIYTASSFLQTLDQVDDIISLFTTFIGAVAAISLVVGGIGVMNIMLVSVTERTREIGIRKAIGATTTNILFQFLTESVILSLIGGFIGMTLGIILSTLGGGYVGITPVISVGQVIGVAIFSSAIGVFFGIYPARKAAKMNPIDALRYE